MAAVKGGSSWVRRHLTDPYVKKANALGYRSRAAFKLTELQKKYNLFKPNMRVLDLGAAPGSWSQVLTKMVGKNGQIIALDLLEMDPLSGVDFLRGDFSSDSTLVELEKLLVNAKLHWVVSDMAPNLSGIITRDQALMMNLAEEVFYFAGQHLISGGGMLVKVFQGSGFAELVQSTRKVFNKVQVVKPPASRSSSRECYILARGYNLG